uniref:Integrase catalytic domain-containing protein n=1 Tax=Phytophthora ramorum TaxID=164328 RepID=H3H6U5_PHYRM
MLDEWKRIDNEMAILTVYPHDIHNFIKENGDNNAPEWIPHLCTTIKGGNGLTRIVGASIKRNAKLPQMAALWGGGLSFSKCHAERNVPVDSHTPWLWDGEEFLRSADYWTHGYDLYSPSQLGNVLYHNYSKKPVNFWESPVDPAAKARDTEMSHNRFRLRVGLGFKGPVDAFELDKFSFGTARSFKDYKKFSNFSFDGWMNETNSCGQLHWVPYTNATVVEEIVGGGWKMAPAVPPTPMQHVVNSQPKQVAREMAEEQPEDPVRQRGLSAHTKNGADIGDDKPNIAVAKLREVEVPKVFMDLSVKFEDFNSTERFLVLDMDKYDLILGMPWLENHEPWIDWRGKAIGASRPAATDRALVSHVPTSVSSRAYHRSRVGNDSEELVAAGAATGVMTPSTAGNGPPQAMPVDRTSSPARGTAMPTVPTAPDYGTVRPSALSTPGKVNSPRETSPRETKAVETVARVEVAGSTSSVGNNVPHGVDGTPDSIPESPPAVGNNGPCRGGHRRRHRRRKPSLLRQTGVATSDSERENSPQARPAEECYHFFDGETGCTVKAGSTTLAALPEVSELLNLEEIWREASPEELSSSSVMDKDVLDELDKKCATRTGSAILENPKDPVYPLVKEFSDVVSKDPPSELPPDRGVRHEIDLVPGTKYCVTRQWPLPRERCEVIDAFFAAKAKAGMVRESKSPHSTPTFCVRKPNGKWRLVHAYNKLNSATVPAQTPIPRKDVLLNNMAGCELYSALDLVDGYYQILMRERDIPLTAVSTPSGMLWEWLVMPQGLSNAPATFNRLVTQLFRPLRAFTQTYFDDIFVHSRTGEGKTAIEVHLEHLRRVFMVMRANKLYANIDKCVFAAQEIKVLGCFVSSVGVRADPEKYSAGYAGLARPLSDLLKKDADWRWESRHQDAFNSIKASLQRAPVLALPDETKPFSVVCDASDYAIGCALLQHDADGHERVISFQSRQLKAAERNYPVQGAPRNERMARWLSFFAEYNFRVEYKPGKLNVLADALSRRPDYELTHISRVTTDLYDRIRLAYRDDENLSPIVRFLTAGKEAKPAWLTPRHRARLHRYAWVDGLLHYRVDPADPPRIVVPNNEDLKYDILQEAHDVPSSGHLGREKTFLSVSQVLWWAHMYKWVATYVKTCKTCQRVKPAGHASAPLQSLPVPEDCWKSMSLDFVFGLPADAQGNTGVLVFVCRLSKMVHLAPVADSVTGEQTARLFLDGVFRYHGLPETIVSDRDPRFTSAFWKTLFQLLGTRLLMSTADHPQTDGQTERVNRVLEDTLRSVYAESPGTWSASLPMVEFALNNAVHAFTGFSPFYLNGLRNPLVPLTLRGDTVTSVVSEVTPASLKK